MEKLTMEQAIEKGYKHFVEEEGENVIAFKKINEHNREYYKEGNYYLVDMNAPIHYSLTEDEIRDLLIDHVAAQDTMADEDDKLATIVAGHDFKQLTDDLNEKFKTCNFYEPTDIPVTF
jgi:hypothetical protein